MTVDGLCAGKSHLAIVTDKPQVVERCMRNADCIIPPNVHMAGIVTIEDVLEKVGRAWMLYSA